VLGALAYRFITEDDPAPEQIVGKR